MNIYKVLFSFFLILVIASSAYATTLEEFNATIQTYPNLVAGWSASTLSGADNSTVSNWTDYTGKNKWYDQATTSSGETFPLPTLNTSYYNGTKTIVFLNSSLDTILGATYTQPVTIYTVWEPRNITSQLTSGAYTVFDGATSPANRRLILRTDTSPTASDGYISMYTGSFYKSDFLASTLNNQKILTNIKYQSQQSSFQLNYVNSSLTNTSSGSHSLNVMILGQSASGSGSPSPLNGQIAEMLIFNGTINATQNAYISQYFVDKYNISASVNPAPPHSTNATFYVNKSNPNCSDAYTESEAQNNISKPSCTIARTISFLRYAGDTAIISDEVYAERIQVNATYNGNRTMPIVVKGANPNSYTIINGSTFNIGSFEDNGIDINNNVSYWQFSNFHIVDWKNDATNFHPNYLPNPFIIYTNLSMSNNGNFSEFDGGTGDGFTSHENGRYWAYDSVIYDAGKACAVDIQDSFTNFTNIDCRNAQDYGYFFYNDTQWSDARNQIHFLTNLTVNASGSCLLNGANTTVNGLVCDNNGVGTFRNFSQLHQLYATSVWNNITVINTPSNVRSLIVNRSSTLTINTGTIDGRIFVNDSSNLILRNVNISIMENVSSTSTLQRNWSQRFRVTLAGSPVQNANVTLLRNGSLVTTLTTDINGYTAYQDLQEYAIASGVKTSYGYVVNSSADGEDNSSVVTLSAFGTTTIELGGIGMNYLYFSSPTVNPGSGASYSPTQNVTFSIDAIYNTSISTIDFVRLELNGINYSTTTSNNVTYTWITPPLKAGTHNYTWYASLTTGESNSTTQATYVITKATPGLDISFSPSQTVQNNTEVIVTGINCPSSLTCELYYLDSLQSNPYIADYNSTGSYVFNYNTTGDENYSSINVIKTLTVSTNAQNTASAIAGINSTTAITLSALGLIAVMIIVAAAWMIIVLLSQGMATEAIMALLVSIVALGIVIMIGAYIVINLQTYITALV